VDPDRGEPLREGWYLMSIEDLESELARWRSSGVGAHRSRALRLSTEEALRYRDAGNLPDEHGRTLRLVLIGNDPRSLNARRLHYEPDYHDEPTWRVEGSRPVNVVPLRPASDTNPGLESWLEDPDLAALEGEWQRTGSAGGLSIPAAYRGFVYKTILSLRAAGKEVTAESVAASVARWLPPSEAERIRIALKDANRE
jgi:hypothetical protein